MLSLVLCKYSVGILCEALKYTSVMGVLVMSLTPQSLLKVTISVFDTLDAFLETLLYYSVPVITRTTVAIISTNTLYLAYV